MRFLGIVLGILFGIVICLFVYAQAIHQRELQRVKPYVTYTRLVYLAEGCDRYKAQSGVWPRSLEQLQSGRPELVDPWDKDAWGRKILVVPYNESTGYGEIISYGRDGKSGGSGDDRDLVIRFPCQSNANWNEAMGNGLYKPRFNP